MNRIDTVRVGKTATSGASLTSVFLCLVIYCGDGQANGVSIELWLV
jgi:hypothetical protein